MFRQEKHPTLEFGVNELHQFLESSKLKHVNKLLRIEDISTVSKLLFYCGLIGLFLVVLSIFIPVMWTLAWVYVIVMVFFTGFIYTKNARFNFVLVLAILTILAFVPSTYCQSLLNVFSLDIVNETHLDNSYMEALGKLATNPLSNLSAYMNNLVDVLNWIFFLAVAGYGVSTLGDVIVFNWGNAVKKGAQIALAIAIYTFVFSLINIASSSKVPLVWETVGGAWGDMLRGVGLARLDQSGRFFLNASNIVNGTYRMIPLFTPICCFGLAFSLRNTDFNSMLFAKNVLEEYTISVERSRFSIGIAVLLSIVMVYIVGYNLVTAEPAVNINPIITVTFYISSCVVLYLIGSKLLILNKTNDTKKYLLDVMKWTIYGLMGLFMWFQVFQPMVYQLNLIDTLSSLITLSQNNSFFQNDILEQMFLVALPETLIFQVLFVGLGNRMYYYFNKTRIQKEQEKSIKLKRWKLAIEYRNIMINENSVSKANIRKIARATVLKQKIDDMTETIKSNRIQKIPYNYFILPTIVSGLIGSFFFSWYHGFRRDVDFITWWQNPLLGMTYFGAGFFLCFIAYYNFIASILVHGFNNIIAIMLSGMM